MSKTTNPFSSYFDDVEELKYQVDDEGLVIVKGIAVLNDIFLKITIRRREGADVISPDNNSLSAKPLYRGTISMISPLDGSVLLSEAKKRAKEAANKQYKDKDIYASINYRCNTADMDVIASTLRRQVDKLLLENEEQHTEMRLKYMSPEKLTPLLASTKYVDGFLAMVYPSSSPERNNKRSQTIQKIFTKLPNKPMRKLRARDISALIEHDHITAENVKLCHIFWTYLLESGKCSGKNPFPDAPVREPSVETMNKKMFTTLEISDNVFAKMFELINKKLSTLYCALVLLISGFTMDDILPLKWGDIVFVQGYDDFAIVHIRKESVVISKHDYSRPAIPDTAMYLKKAYDVLCTEYGTETVKNWNIAASETSRSKPADRKLITETANNLLVRAGYVGRLTAPGRSGEKEPIPITLLRKNYQRMLYTKCGLNDDPDTYSFLASIQLKSSTYINYESHTSPEAQYRLYTILKSISIENKLRKPTALRETKECLVYTATPITNHEVVRVIGDIVLKPGEKIIIRCPHGVTGRIQIT